MLSPGANLRWIERPLAFGAYRNDRRLAFASMLPWRAKPEARGGQVLELLELKDVKKLQ